MSVRLRAEQALAASLPMLLGTSALTVSYSQVRAVADRYGHPGWPSWLIAATVEFLALTAALEARRRRLHGTNTTWPVSVLAIGLAVSAAANLRATAHAGAWGYAVSAWPAVAWALAISLHATRPLGRAMPVPNVAGREATLNETAVSLPVPVPPAAECEGHEPEAVESAPAPVPSPGTEHDAVPAARTLAPSPDLMDTARDVAAEYERDGTALTRDGLRRALADRGHRIGTRRTGAVLAGLRESS